MKKSILFFTILLIMNFAFGQQKYTIKVVDTKSGEPVSNASVLLKRTNKGITTNSNGQATITANANDELEITNVGYKPFSVKLADLLDIVVSLERANVDMGEIVVLGTRGVARAKTESVVPIDVIKINQTGLPTAKMDLTSVLNMAAPSFNYNKQSGADGADHVDLGTLRGLGPDQTLVLINGKRRHQTAFVALFGTRGRGNSGTDLNAFPQSMVDRIEILRDGASAQYGSDAMAGVMNLILKKEVNHLSINTGWSGYYDTKYNALLSIDPTQYYTSKKIDGGTRTFSVNNGWNLGKQGGFLNVSLDLLKSEKTFRQVKDTNSVSNKNALPYFNSGRRAFGDGSLSTAGVMFNSELPIKNNLKFYSFGAYNHKASDAFAYTRNYSAKPERFPTNSNGSLIYIPDIMRKSSDGEIYYNPHIQTIINDQSIALGLKGNVGSGWGWDLSNTIGKNDFHFYGDKTFNASLINQSGPNHFNDGGFNFLQNTFNLDFSKSFPSEIGGTNIGIGAEARIEKYQIYQGELASYSNYHPTDLFYPNVYPSGEYRTPAAGSQGFPGFSNADVVKANRTNLGLYADAEMNWTKELLVDLAVRLENYSDFGFLGTMKAAARYKINPKLNIRGSISSGYRAPSLQQINFSNTLTSFSNGQLIQSRISSNTDAITKAAGIPSLKQETSTNSSLGFSWKPVRGFTMTIDGYQVNVKNRIVLSGLFSASDATLPTALTNALNNINVATAQFFANAVGTTNYGVDVVMDFSKKMANGGTFKALLASNFQKMKINSIHVPSALNTNILNQKTFFSDREEAFLLASAPKAKVAISLSYNKNNFGVGTHLTYYGKVVLKGFGSPTVDNPNSTGINPQVPNDVDGTLVPEDFNYKGKLVTDIYASYKFSKKITAFAGVDNIMNLHPNLGVNPLARGWAGDNESGGAWDSVQMGFNGRKLFVKLSFNF